MGKLNNMIRIGGLEIGKVPRVVGTLTSFSGLTEFPGSGRVCDIAEVRLDLIGANTGWVQECQRIQNAGIPIILTLRSVAEGGKFDGSKEKFLSLYRQGIDVVSALDVELASHWVEPVLALANSQGKAVIISFHDFKKTPDFEQMHQIFAQAKRHSAIVKISTMINDPGDLDKLSMLLRQREDIPLCVIGMGPLGRRSRTEFPHEGSCLTYGYIDSIAAPGQLHARELFELLSGFRERS